MEGLLNSPIYIKHCQFYSFCFGNTVFLCVDISTKRGLRCVHTSLVYYTSYFFIRNLIFGEGFRFLNFPF